MKLKPGIEAWVESIRFVNLCRSRLRQRDDRREQVLSIATNSQEVGR